MCTPFTTRVIGYLLVALPIIGLIFLAGPMLAPHQYYWAFVTGFVLACIAALCLVIYGLRTFFRA